MTMTPRTRGLLSLAMGALAAGLVPAGTLEPPGPPAPTMFTLQQIYDEVATTPALWGSLQPPPGAPGPTMVTLQGIYAAIDTNRFTDLGNGTVRDNVTKLVWLKNANCMSANTWNGANQAAGQLGQGTPGGIACGLTDGSVPGDWRLPSVACLSTSSGSNCTSGSALYLHSAGGEFTTIYGPGCASRPLNRAGTACVTEGDPFTGVLNASYWSSGWDPTAPASFALNLTDGSIIRSNSSSMLRVWPVRSGP